MNEKTNLELVKEKMPELVAGWNKMSKGDLLNQIAAEVLDLWAMQERVATFMEECTSLSYTTYSPDTLRGLINDHKKQELALWCSYVIEDADNDPQEVYKSIKEEADKV